MALLTAFAATSCTKSYECTCTETETEQYQAVMPQSQSTVDSHNASIASSTDPNESDKTVTTYDKTSKKAANAACASRTEVETDPQADTGDANGNGDRYETYYNILYTTTYDCSTKKK